MNPILEALLGLVGTVAITAVTTRLYLEVIGMPVLTEAEWAVQKSLTEFGESHD